MNSHTREIAKLVQSGALTEAQADALRAAVSDDLEAQRKATTASVARQFQDFAANLQ